MIFLDFYRNESFESFLILHQMFECDEKLKNWINEEGQNRWGVVKNRNTFEGD
jgi:hypothetical protein